jgi:adenine-specific DNA-methyltransferase
MGEVYRITRPDGSFWLNVGYVEMSQKGKAIPLPYLLWNRSPFYLLQEIVWNYGAGVAAKKSLSPRNEKFLWYVKDANNYTFNLNAIRDPDVKYPQQKKNGKLRCNTIGKNPSDVCQIAKVTFGADRASPERTPHPAQFPLDLVNRVVIGFSNPGELVFDPFLGSGTVAVSDQLVVINGLLQTGHLAQLVLPADPNPRHRSTQIESASEFD